MKLSVSIRTIALILALAAAAAAPGAVRHAGAAGTAAGTTIANQASASYTLDGSPATTLSNVSSIRVSELISCTVAWLDVAPGVPVNPGEANRTTTFRLTNTGNGTEVFGLSGLSAGITGDQFDPVLGSLYLDSNGNGTYEAGIDALYVPGTNDPSLAPDGSVTVFIMNTMPGSGIVDGDTGNTRLTATSNTGTGPAGTVLPAAGDSGTDAVIGSSGGSAAATGAYVVRTLALSATKTVTVMDQFGGSLAIPGATLRYVITYTLTGNGSVNGAVISDPLPANTTYVAGSLRLNGTVLTDDLDGDEGDVNFSAANTVTVNLGNLTAPMTAQAIQFDVKIQ